MAWTPHLWWACWEAHTGSAALVRGAARVLAGVSCGALTALLLGDSLAPNAPSRAAAAACVALLAGILAGRAP